MNPRRGGGLGLVLAVALGGASGLQTPRQWLESRPACGAYSVMRTAPLGREGAAWCPDVGFHASRLQESLAELSRERVRFSEGDLRHWLAACAAAADGRGEGLVTSHAALDADGSGRVEFSAHWTPHSSAPADVRPPLVVDALLAQRSRPRAKLSSWTRERRPLEARGLAECAETLLCRPCHATGALQLLEGLTSSLLAVHGGAGGGAVVVSTPREHVLESSMMSMALEECAAMGLEVVRAPLCAGDAPGWEAVLLLSVTRVAEPVGELIMHAVDVAESNQEPLIRSSPRSPPQVLHRWPQPAPASTAHELRRRLLERLSKPSRSRGWRSVGDCDVAWLRGVCAGAAGAKN